MTRKELDRNWSPDEVAECCDVDNTLRCTLWRLVPKDQPVPGENDWPEGPRFKPYPWADKLTDDEFALVTEACSSTTGLD